MKELSDLAGADPQAQRLLELATTFNDTAFESSHTEGQSAYAARMLEASTAMLNATIAVGRKNETRAIEQFRELAETVDRWKELSYEPARAGIDHDSYVADTEILSVLFRLIHDESPCWTSLEAQSTESVGDLHPTRRGWPHCGCSANETGTQRRLSAVKA